MRTYERGLPHGDTVGGALFVTFRFYGSLPANRGFPPERLSDGRAFAAWINYPPVTEPHLHFSAGRRLRIGRFGLFWAASALDARRLDAFVGMPNHVHRLVTPQVTARQWLGP